MSAVTVISVLILVFKFLMFVILTSTVFILHNAAVSKVVHIQKIIHQEAHSYMKPVISIIASSSWWSRNTVGKNQEGVQKLVSNIFFYFNTDLIIVCLNHIGGRITCNL